MHSSTLTKITIGTLGVLLAGTSGLAVRNADQAAAWQRQSAQWRSAAQRTNAAATRIGARDARLVRRYNRLVRLAAAGTTMTPAAQPASASVSAQAAPTVQAAPAAAPTSKAS